jgi:hypothetical protein
MMESLDQSAMGSNSSNRPTLSREATAAAYEKHLLARGNYAGVWDILADGFAEDATYLDSFYGETQGREAIRAFLKKSMEGIEHWSFPVVWTVIGEGKVVTHWLNRLPGNRPDGSYYEFPGVSCIIYGPDGLITRQMDMYDTMIAMRVVMEAKSGVFGRAIRAVASPMSAFSRELIRAIYRVLEAARK